MYLCKQLTDCSLPEIGRRFGGKHHSTVIHAVQKIEKKRKAETGLRQAAGQLSCNRCDFRTLSTAFRTVDRCGRSCGRTAGRDPLRITMAFSEAAPRVYHQELPQRNSLTVMELEGISGISTATSWYDY